MRVTTRVSVSLLLVAAFAMVFETSCSQAPSPQLASQPATSVEIRSRLVLYAEDRAMIRIHTVDGTIIPTSRYQVVDSVVVIENVLRGDDYFPEENQLRLYGDHPQVKKLPKNVTLPLAVPIDQVATVERWQNPHTTERGVLSGIVIFGAVAVVVVSVIALYRSAFKNSPWDWH